ncbi:hypothetical protein HHL22_12930 [Hymenobacter sp. RP-2-7]|uniref:STAS/SEC14 domain-containing protein n=1 Tax=Hymenobacter polaris TaxID=2682546 RepID=A0A7Y0AF08_9BACT|nr:hypothetical protein [Hymenobacter polaris]NML66111.1 hypothetical protein [Hymenobacter polaris]
MQADPAGLLRIAWGSQPRSLAATQALFEQLLRQLQTTRWSRVLVNQVQMPPFSPAEQQWVATNWLPRAVAEGGYRHGAVLVSPTVLVRLATAYITTYVQGLPLVYRSFDSEADAVRWLLRQPATAA